MWVCGPLTVISLRDAFQQSDECGVEPDGCATATSIGWGCAGVPTYWNCCAEARRTQNLNLGPGESFRRVLTVLEEGGPVAS